jgi:hypothetical protein
MVQIDLYRPSSESKAAGTGGCQYQSCWHSPAAAGPENSGEGKVVLQRLTDGTAAHYVRANGFGSCDSRGHIHRGALSRAVNWHPHLTVGEPKT